MIRTLVRLSVLALALAALAGTAGHAQGRSMKSSASKAAKPTAAAPVNLNTATAAELRTLPNIGAATAARILEYRQKNGGFKKIEDLMNVKGIGEKSFLKLRPLVAVVPPKPADH